MKLMKLPLLCADKVAACVHYKLPPNFVIGSSPYDHISRPF